MKKIIFLVVLLLFVVSTGYCSNESFVIKELDLELIKCPAGRFMMGSPEDEFGREDRLDEKLHSVIISKPFYIGQYEVTQSQYESVMGYNPSYFKGGNNPVESVSWFKAKIFCIKLNFLYKNYLPKGYRFDLPTEAQWEYACRAGTTTSLNSGKNITSGMYACKNFDEVGWYDDNADKQAHPVGQKKPNAWGIYDMHGNVAEWCNGFYGEYPKEEVIDPKGPNSGTYYILRGGCWNSDADRSRSAFRGLIDKPYMGDCTVGFRVAVVPIN